MKQQSIITFDQQVSEVELIYKSKIKNTDRPQINSCQAAVQLLRQSWDPDQLELRESLKVLYLNRAGRVLGIYSVSNGGLTEAVADPRLIFAAALRLLAPSAIICHNHPSGLLRPSDSDKRLTAKLQQGGALLEIKILDHIILTADGYYSFAEAGLL